MPRYASCSASSGQHPRAALPSRCFRPRIHLGSECTEVVLPLKLVCKQPGGKLSGSFVLKAPMMQAFLSGWEDCKVNFGVYLQGASILQVGTFLRLMLEGFNIL